MLQYKKGYKEGFTSGLLAGQLMLGALINRLIMSGRSAVSYTHLTLPTTSRV